MRKALCKRQHRHFTPPRVPQFSNCRNFCASASYDLHFSTPECSGLRSAAKCARLEGSVLWSCAEKKSGVENGPDLEEKPALLVKVNFSYNCVCKEHRKNLKIKASDPVVKDIINNKVMNKYRYTKNMIKKKGRCPEEERRGLSNYIYWILK